MKCRISDFVVKVWLTSILLAPCLLTLRALVTASSFHITVSDIQLFFVIILFGAILSLPSLALFYFAGRVVINRIGITLASKTILSIAGVILTYIPFLIIDKFHPLLDVDKLSRSLFIAYAFMTIAGIWIYKIKPVPPPVAEPPERIHI